MENNTPDFNELKSWNNDHETHSGIRILKGGAVLIWYTPEPKLLVAKDFPALDQALNFITNDLKLPLDYGTNKRV